MPYPGEVSITSKTRTKPSAAELLAHQLPGRNTHADRIRWGVDTKLRNQVQLTTYPDCIGGKLSDLQSFVDRYLAGVVGGVHILPFYPSSADRGFAPLTYKEVDPTFGSWDEIESFADGLDLCVDFMVNHISAQSEQFKDFVEKGDKVYSPDRLPSFRICELARENAKLSKRSSGVLSPKAPTVR
jgi:glycosidase